MIRMHIEAVDLADRAGLCQFANLHRLVVTRCDSVRTKRGVTNSARRLLCACLMVEHEDAPRSALLFKDRRPTNRVFLDRQRRQVFRINDSRIALLPTANSNDCQIVFVTTSCFSHRHQPIVTPPTLTASLNFAIATYLAFGLANSSNQYVRFEFTDLHQRCNRSAATYLRRTIRLQLPVAEHRSR
jgi:hypothetical protein